MSFGYRPPAKAWQTFDSIPAEGVDIKSPSPRFHLLEVHFHAAGNFVSVQAGSEDGQPVALAVNAGERWPIEFTRIDAATTALPLTILWGPLR